MGWGRWLLWQWGRSASCGSDDGETMHDALTSVKGLSLYLHGGSPSDEATDGCVARWSRANELGGANDGLVACSQLSCGPMDAPAKST